MAATADHEGEVVSTDKADGGGNMGGGRGMEYGTLRWVSFYGGAAFVELFLLEHPFPNKENPSMIFPSLPRII